MIVLGFISGIDVHYLVQVVAGSLDFHSIYRAKIRRVHPVLNPDRQITMSGLGCLKAVYKLREFPVS
jgi:hypothetical protein